MPLYFYFLSFCLSLLSLFPPLISLPPSVLFIFYFIFLHQFPPSVFSTPQFQLNTKKMVHAIHPPPHSCPPLQHPTPPLVLQLFLPYPCLSQLHPPVPGPEPCYLSGPYPLFRNHLPSHHALL